ncbi:hypothetical protein D3Z53_25855 [Lachnospiraceae bacterium]|nr:hypothetical protein [uncultured Schaedlerella sp.]NBI61319.1 hypothetical protein [Lachnospiraceae bacterium]
MSGLVIRDKNGENISYFGTQFEGLEDMGSRHLCVRTGSGAEGVVKYALTSKPLNDKYKALRMQIADGASGKEAYIAQRYVESRTVSVSTSCTSSRSSQYTTIETLTSASSSKSSTTNATRSVTQSPVYYGSRPMIMVGTRTMYLYGQINTQTYTTKMPFPPKHDDFTYPNTVVKFMTASSSTNFSSTLYGSVTVTERSEVTSSQLGYAHSLRKTVSYPYYTVTETRTSRISNYTVTTRLSTASRSSTRTVTASRTSEYTSSTSALSTESFTSHNVDL